MQTFDPQANLRESEHLFGTDAAASNPNSRETTVDSLCSALETSTSQTRPASWVDEYLAEAACTRAVELACVVGVDEALRKPVNSDAIDESAHPEEIGPYHLLAWLGQGGMGTVYKAVHRRLDKIVALKVIQSRRLDNVEMLHRFEREMKAIGNLDHPHLIRALDAGDDNGTHYLAMEFAEGLDLAALLALRGPLPISEACELTVQAASGLHAAHSRGIIHRDIKPANLILTLQEFGPPILKILDLGLALFAAAPTDEKSGITSNGQIMGTVEYMAPEQADDSHAVDRRADIYSLGATLYTLVTGASIFAGRPPQTLMQKLSVLANGSVQPICERRPEIEKPLADIIHRMLARNPADRFATMNEVIVGLKPYTVGADLAALIPVPADQQSINHRDRLEAGGDRTRAILLSDQPISSGVPRNDFESNPSTAGQDHAHTAISDSIDWGSKRATPVTQRIEHSQAAGPAVNDSTRTLPNRVTGGLQRPPRWLSQTWSLVAGIGLIAAVLVSSIILSVKTPTGELLVEIPDNLPADLRQEIKIEVSGNGNAQVINEARGWLIGVSEGKYQIRLTGGDDRLKLENNQVFVTRDKQAIVTVTLTPPQQEVAKNAVDQLGYRWPKDEPPPAIAPFTSQKAREHQAAWARHLGLPVEYTNSVGMKLTLIPPGEFMMGSTPAEQASVMDEAIAITDERWPQFIKSEGPQHKVILTKPIYLGIHEVTQSQYQAVMGKNPSAYVASNPIGSASVKGLNTDRFPVESVQYEEMTEFSLKLSQREGIESLDLTPGSSVALMKDTSGYRLPTEAEWEFACRAGTTTRYWNGEREVDLLSSSWPPSASRECPFPVGTTRANPFGLFDMLSNLTELTQDEDDPNAPATYYSQFAMQPAINPKGRPAQVFRIAKGGNFHSQAWQSRAARRWIHALGHGGPEIGFRVAISCDAVRNRLKSNPASGRTSTDPDSQFAEWLLSQDAPLKFEVTLPNGAIQEVSRDQPLPTGPIRLNYLRLSGSMIDQLGDGLAEVLETRLKGLHLTGFSIHSQTLTSAGIAKLVQIPAFSDLDTLEIAGPAVNDDVFEALRPLSKLTSVHLRCPKLTGKGLHHLQRLGALVLLECENLTAHAIVELQQLPQLRSLHVGGPRLTDQHLSALVKLNLAQLIHDSSGSNGMEDTQMSQLALMPSLELLCLRDHPFTDQGLKELKQRKSLKQLDVTGTRVTAAGIADLQKELPNCKIVWSEK